MQHLHRRTHSASQPSRSQGRISPSQHQSRTRVVKNGRAGPARPRSTHVTAAARNWLSWAGLSVSAHGSGLGQQEAATMIQDGPLLDQLLRVTGTRDPRDLERWVANQRSMRDLDNELKGIEVKLTHTGQTTKTLVRFGDPANKVFFEHNGKKVSVAQYFQERYGTPLKYPGLPCVVDKKKSAFPLEVCVVRRSSKRVADMAAKEQATLIRQTAVKPVERLRIIRQLLRAPLALAGLSTPLTKNFTLAFRSAGNADVLRVPARVLQGPYLQYSGGSNPCAAAENSGAWSPPSGARPVHTPGRWTSGAVLSFCPQASPEGANIAKLAQDITRTLASSYGATTPSGQLPIIWADSPADMRSPERAADNAVKAARKAFGEDPQLLVVVLPARGEGGPLRKALKYYLDHAEDPVTTTQCINPAKAKLSRGPADMSYVDNVCLKVNTKLGGKTSCLPATNAAPGLSVIPAFRGKRVMIIGADLSRGGPPVVSVSGEVRSGAGEGAGGRGVRVEYVAVVGTTDVDAALLDAHVLMAQRSDSGSTDIILGMEEAVGELLDMFTARNRELPDVVLVVRDGVSDSQFDAVLASEYTAVKQAIASRNKSGKKIDTTVVAVQKSHNTRLFPLDNDMSNTHRSGNILPGTVVERGILDPQAYSFYLNSHAGLQGTNKVPRFQVLVDECCLLPEELQYLLFWGAHLYPVCHRSISVPPPVRYADIGAERAREIADDDVGSQLTPQQPYIILDRQQGKMLMV